MHIQQSRTYKIDNITPPPQYFNAGVIKTGQGWSRYWGDDATYQRGVGPSGSRFNDNGDGTITDNLTGLMWVKDPSELYGPWGSPGMPNTMSWYDAINNCENLEHAGYTDWRLPNIRELESLINFGTYGNVIDGMYFPNAQSSGYWSSTLLEPYDYYGWFIYFYDGMRGVEDRNYYEYVRPVRGGV
jgi:hypothetical protein